MFNRLYILIFTIAFIAAGCSGDSSDNGQYLVRVNDFILTEDEADSLLKFEAELDSNFYLSEDTRTEFVRGLIQSQLLIQEAKKQQFDQRENFRKTIQRYWESTLIRDLLAEKGEKIRLTTVVSEEEIEAYYKENKEFLSEGSLQELKPEIARLIEDKKINEKIEKWIDQLKADADIEITDKELALKVEKPRE